MSRIDKGKIVESVLNSINKPTERAVEAVAERRLMKLFCRNNEEVVELYVFYGRDRSYMLVPGMFCGCKDFEINVVLRREKGSCYHLVALELARRKGVLKTLEVSCDTVREIVLELLLNENSLTLRKIVHYQASR
ncbi:MAG: hypothetical protein RMI56_06240 [Sulfolobales archaeon]|nr:hypothetical protein [Sulfolobales archaeon]MDW8083376.1 hypothetical protein [Sulfolobales archaeon]